MKDAKLFIWKSIAAGRPIWGVSTSLWMAPRNLWATIWAASEHVSDFFETRPEAIKKEPAMTKLKFVEHEPHRQSERPAIQEWPEKPKEKKSLAPEQFRMPILFSWNRLAGRNNQPGNINGIWNGSTDKSPWPRSPPSMSDFNDKHRLNDIFW